MMYADLVAQSLSIEIAPSVRWSASDVRVEGTDLYATISSCVEADDGGILSMTEQRLVVVFGVTSKTQRTVGDVLDGIAQGVRERAKTITTDDPHLVYPQEVLLASLWSLEDPSVVASLVASPVRLAEHDARWQRDQLIAALPPLADDIAGEFFRFVGPKDDWIECPPSLTGRATELAPHLMAYLVHISDEDHEYCAYDHLTELVKSMAPAQGVPATLALYPILEKSHQDLWGYCEVHREAALPILQEASQGSDPKRCSAAISILLAVLREDDPAYKTAVWQALEHDDHAIQAHGMTHAENCLDGALEAKIKELVVARPEQFKWHVPEPLKNDPAIQSALGADSA